MITFVVALHSEARPLIEHFGLSTVHTRHPYTIVGTDRRRLVVSGMGKSASAAATSFCAGRFEDSLGGAWLNLGIAGHRTHAVGTALLAREVRDASSGAFWHTSPLFPAPCATAAVTSFDTPNLEYPGHTACDMEAAGFVAAASRCAPLPLVQILKVVSDTASADIRDLDRERIGALIEGALATIELVADGLARLLDAVRPRLHGAEFEAVLERWRFTTTQRMQLATIACRWALAMPEAPWPQAELDTCSAAAEVLRILDRHLGRPRLPTRAGDG